MPGMDAMPMEMGESPGGIDKKLSGNHNQKTRFFIKPNLMQLHSLSPSRQNRQEKG